MSSFEDLEMALNVLRKKIQSELRGMHVPVNIQVSGHHIRIDVESENEEDFIFWAEEHQDEFD